MGIFIKDSFFNEQPMCTVEKGALNSLSVCSKSSAILYTRVRVSEV